MAPKRIQPSVPPIWRCGRSRDGVGMLWPEGPAAILGDIGAYLDPPLNDEQIEDFSVSKMGAYAVLASQRVLGLFRLRPLTPLAIYVDLFDEHTIRKVIASPNGSFVAVLTSDDRITVFGVKPRHDIEEVLKTTYAVTPGPGEAIGARELWIEPLHAVFADQKVISLDVVGAHIIAYTANEILCGQFADFESTDPLRPPVLLKLPVNFSDKSQICCGHAFATTKHKWSTCLRSTTGKTTIFTPHFPSTEETETESTPAVSETGGVLVELEISDVVVVDYSYRMKKLALGTNSGQVWVLNAPLDAQVEPFEISMDSKRQLLSLRWTPAGTVLLIGYSEGYQLVSMLGLPLYTSNDIGSSDVIGVKRAEWLVSAESVVLLGTDGRVRVQNMLHWGGLPGSERFRPVLQGNGRLMLHYDPSSRGINSSEAASQSWLTIPLPTWYSAQNWPITHVCSSPDGRFVAIAGAAGIMMFNVSTRQWKEIGVQETLVRGGLCWHGRRLIAAVMRPDTGSVTLQMYSPAGSLPQNSSSSMLKHWWTGKRNKMPSLPVGEQPNTNPTIEQRLLGPKLEPNRLDAPQQLGLGLADTTRSSLNLPEPDSPFTNTGQRRLSGPENIPNINSPGTAMSPSSPGTAFNSSVNMTSLVAMAAEQQVVASDLIGHGPSSVVSLMTVSSNGLLGILTGIEHQRLLIYDLDRLDFELVHDLPLANVLATDDNSPAVRAFTMLSDTQVLVLVGATLMLVSSADETNRQYQRQIVAEPIETYEYLPTERQLVVFDGQDVVITNWAPEQSDEAKFFATIPLDAYPVRFSSHRGVLSLIECEPMRSFDNSFVVARPSMSHEVCIQYILESALVPAYNTAKNVAEKYAKAPYFAGVLESLLYRVVVKDDNKDQTVKQLSAAVKLLREFPEQNFAAIIAGCARKVEMKYWPKLFAAVESSPSELFDACLAAKDFVTANEFLIVVQTSGSNTPEPDSDELDVTKFDLDGRILRLYEAAAAAKNFWICKQVCEFIMALDSSGKALSHFYGLVKA